jgi:uncharacterized protein involved in outer membrane biogenesis
MFVFAFLFRLVARVVGFVVKAALFVAAVGAVAAAVGYALFDGQAYKQRVQQRVVDLTGRALTVSGAAELQMSIPPRIVLNDVRLKNAPWGSRPDMARIRQVQVKINPLSAISGGDSVAQVQLDGADVLLETAPDGIGNWEWALGGGAGIGALGILDALGLFSSTSSASAPSVVISNSTVTFRDGGTGRTTTGPLGGIEFAGKFPNEAFGGGSHVLAAANSDDTNPCDGTQKDDKKDGQKDSQKDKPPPQASPLAAPPPPRPALR